MVLETSTVSPLRLERLICLRTPKKNLLLAASFSVSAVWDEAGADLHPPRAQGEGVHWLCAPRHWQFAFWSLFLEHKSPWSYFIIGNFFFFFLHRALHCNSSISLSHRKKLWQSPEVSWKKLLRNKCEEWSLRGTIFSRVFSCISLLVLTVWAWSNR